MKEIIQLFRTKSTYRFLQTTWTRVYRFTERWKRNSEGKIRVFREIYCSPMIKMQNIQPKTTML